MPGEHHCNNPMKSLTKLSLAFALLYVFCSSVISCRKEEPQPHDYGPAPDTSDMSIREVASVRSRKNDTMRIYFNRNIGWEEIKPTKVFINGKERPSEFVYTCSCMKLPITYGFDSGPVQVEWKGSMITGPKVYYDSAYYLYHFAGSNESGFVNGDSSDARFNMPGPLTMDTAGNTYLVDVYNSSIRKISPTGKVSTFAGAGVYGFKDGTGEQAQFANPRDVAIDHDGNLFVTDAGNYRVRKITPAGEVTTYAGGNGSQNIDGTGTSAGFGLFNGIAVDTGGVVYVVSDQQIRIITKDLKVTTLVTATISYNDGPLADARFAMITDLTFDSKNNLYVCDYGMRAIRRISNGIVKTIQSPYGGYRTPFGVPVFLNIPGSITTAINDDILVANTFNWQTFSLAPNGIATILTTSIFDPAGIAMDRRKNIVISSQTENKIYRMVWE
jgi:hypothetical protein